MSEGFFPPGRRSIPGISVDRLLGAMVRVVPTTRLRLGLVETREAAAAAARNEVLEDGSEIWHRAFTRADLGRVDDPEFAMAMVRHEFALAVRAGAAFPVEVPLLGGGSGFCIDATGHVLTNYHLVAGEVHAHGREGGVTGVESMCRSLRVDVACRDGSGAWAWQPAERVWLESNPPRSRAIRDAGDGRGVLQEDTALLRVEPVPAACLELDARAVRAGEPVWMAGFPLRSARPKASRQALGYADADGTLRVSAGRVTAVDDAGFFTTDLDGSMGSSGSPVLDADGRVIGLFSRATGNGPRNAFEYGFTPRVHVDARLAVDGLGLRPTPSPKGSVPPAKGSCTVPDPS